MDPFPDSGVGTFMLLRRFLRGPKSGAGRRHSPDRSIKQLDRVYHVPLAAARTSGSRNLERASGIASRDDVRRQGRNVRRLAGAKLGGRLGRDQVVNTGAAAANLGLGRGNELDAGYRREQDSRRGPDTLRM